MAHICIIGSGIIGLCIAHACRQRGHRVTLIDRNPQRRDGCSFGNAGMVVPSHFIPLAAPGMVALGLKWMWNPESPFYIKPRLDRDLMAWGWRFWRAATAERVGKASPLIRDLSLASRAAYAELAREEGMDFGWVERGLLMLCRETHTLEEEARTAEQSRALGIPAEVLDPGQLARLEPGVRMSVAGAVYFPKDCHLSPGRLMSGLEARLVAGGTRFLWGCEVNGWRVDGRRVAAVETVAGVVEADEFVLAGGAWTAGLGKALGLNLPLQAGKGYSLTLAQPRQLPQICAIFTEARVAVTPMGSELRFGGTMEIAGLNEDINPVRVRGIVKSVPGYYPEFAVTDFDGVKPWRGLRPCSPDGLPYLGRSGGHDNLLVAAGHAMMGLSLGPVTGRLIAQMVSGERPMIDVALMSPDRYGA
jgi:D-amino-acid dehydrogenase